MSLSRFFSLTRLWSLSPTEHTIKQEEVGEEEAERRVPGLEETAQSGEEGSGIEEPMMDSPNNLQDMGPAPDGPNDTPTRLPNGELLTSHSSGAWKI